MKGASRYLNRLWNLVQAYLESGIKKELNFTESSEEVRSLRNKTHHTLRKVKDDFLRRHSFNTAIASVMELTNSIPKYFLSDNANEAEKSSVKEAIEAILISLSPITPHITHSLWKQLGNKNAIIDVEWPEANQIFLEEETFLLVIQVNGKLRGNITINKKMSQTQIEKLAMKEENVKKYLEEKQILNIIHVPGKLLNFVAS